MKRCLLLMMLPLAMMAQHANPNRDYAALRADVDRLFEQQKVLYSEILVLRQDMKAQDERIKKALKLLDALDARVSENDTAWKAQILEIRKILDTEHNARIQSTTRLEEELKNSEKRRSQASAASSSTGSYIVITIEKGDTLGSIAKTTKASVEEIRKLNNLKNDTIYVGQELKVPVKK